MRRRDFLQIIALTAGTFITCSWLSKDSHDPQQKLKNDLKKAEKAINSGFESLLQKSELEQLESINSQILGLYGQKRINNTTKLKVLHYEFSKILRSIKVLELYPAEKSQIISILDLQIKLLRSNGLYISKPELNRSQELQQLIDIIYESMRQIKIAHNPSNREIL